VRRRPDGQVVSSSRAAASPSPTHSSLSLPCRGNRPSEEGRPEYVQDLQRGGIVQPQQSAVSFVQDLNNLIMSGQRNSLGLNDQHQQQHQSRSSSPVRRNGGGKQLSYTANQISSSSSLSSTAASHTASSTNSGWAASQATSSTGGGGASSLVVDGQILSGNVSMTGLASQFLDGATAGAAANDPSSALLSSFNSARSAVGGGKDLSLNLTQAFLQRQQQPAASVVEPSPATSGGVLTLRSFQPAVPALASAGGIVSVSQLPPGATLAGINMENSLTPSVAAAALGGSVPEFLYQLTKMLTDDNRSIIEWSTFSGAGRIEVHAPTRLEREVLGKYFRHSKYSSFQRQLNYFGFRKIAGKGKMSPCSYINDDATTDIRCLLLMKRKNAKEKAADAEARRIAQEEEARAAEEAAAFETSKTSASNRNKRRAARSTRARSKRRAASNVSYVELAGEDVDEDGVENNGDDQDDEYTDGTSAAAARRSPRSSRRTYTSTSRSTGGTNSMFSAMAANVASNIASNGINVSRDNGNSKRPKTADGRGYTVAKGIKHGLGFLRPNTKEEVKKARANGGKPVVPSSVPSSAVSSAPPPTTVPPTSSSKPVVNYLSHPPANQATCAPAPLQFLDPGELGMSLESSLSQLKDNFAQASAGASTKTCQQPESGSSSGTGGVKYAPSALTRRFTDASFIGGLLSRDDSLINLAMLPTAEEDQPVATGGAHQGGDAPAGTGRASASVVSTNPNTTASVGGEVTTEESASDGAPLVQKYHFKRDDSLINLAASVDITQQSGDGNDGGVESSEVGAFGFFP